MMTSSRLAFVVIVGTVAGSVCGEDAPRSTEPDEYSIVPIPIS
jgi:hypothetical protein